MPRGSKAPAIRVVATGRWMNGLERFTCFSASLDFLPRARLRPNQRTGFQDHLSVGDDRLARLDAVLDHSGRILAPGQGDRPDRGLFVRADDIDEIAVRS